MAGCTEVVERLIEKDGKWEWTRTFIYADGSSKQDTSDDYGCYWIVPAAPGWVAATDSYYRDAARDHHAIAAWKCFVEHGDIQMTPLFPGDRSMVQAVAVMSPDGRVFEVLSHECLHNEPYPSLNAWHEHVERKRAAHLAEEERRRIEREKHKCPTCGHSHVHDELPF